MGFDDVLLHSFFFSQFLVIFKILILISCSSGFFLIYFPPVFPRGRGRKVAKKGRKRVKKGWKRGKKVGKEDGKEGRDGEMGMMQRGRRIWDNPEGLG